MEKAMFKMGVNPICGRLNGESIGNLQLFRSWEKKMIIQAWLTNLSNNQVKWFDHKSLCNEALTVGDRELENPSAWRAMFPSSESGATWAQKLTEISQNLAESLLSNSTHTEQTLQTSPLVRGRLRLQQNLDAGWMPTEHNWTILEGRAHYRLHRRLVFQLGKRAFQGSFPCLAGQPAPGQRKLPNSQLG